SRLRAARLCRAAQTLRPRGPRAGAARSADMEGRARTAHGGVGQPVALFDFDVAAVVAWPIWPPITMIRAGRSSSDLPDLRVGDPFLPFCGVRLDVSGQRSWRHSIPL